MCYSPHKVGLNGHYQGKGRADANKGQIQVQCGQCLECRQARARQWSIRCMKECEYHAENYFITITYTDECMPLDGLKKAHLQKLFKRLRKDGKEFRYFACGEYSPKKYRPHYHVLFFGLSLDDMYVWDSRKHYYRSYYFDAKWGQGMCIIGEVTPESANYVARYTLKKSLDQQVGIADGFAENEFQIMSLKPSIGKRYFEDNVESIIRAGGIMYRTKKGDVKYLPVPRSYVKLIENDEELMRIREWQQLCRDRNAPQLTLEEWHAKNATAKANALERLDCFKAKARIKVSGYDV